MARHIFLKFSMRVEWVKSCVYVSKMSRIMCFCSFISDDPIAFSFLSNSWMKSQRIVCEHKCKLPLACPCLKILLVIFWSIVFWCLLFWHSNRNSFSWWLVKICKRPWTKEWLNILECCYCAKSCCTLGPADSACRGADETASLDSF